MALSTEHTAEFSLWLSAKLKTLETDDDVFGEYIRGILTGDDTIEEKRDALEGLLSEVVDVGGALHVDEIIQKWQSYEPVENMVQRVVNVDAQLAKLIESHSLATTATRTYTEEEKKIREAILSQYSELTDDEGKDEACGGEEEVDEAWRNTNVADVAAAAKERRELARAEAARKKEKDKEDREKQRQQREDKKEKRKTVKGERRR